jgi:uncharacterized damage-inducible protein DinB
LLPQLGETLPSLDTIVANLDREQESFLRAADAVPSDQWQTPPGEARWSAGELVGHLITIERAILRNLDKVLQKPPRAVPFYKRVHFPMALVEFRLLRRKTPLPTDPELVREKEAMLAELREVRERTLAFIDETRTQELQSYSLPHAFLGTLNLYEWLQLIASHEARHTKQMREISVALPKVVANLQK